MDFTWNDWIAAETPLRLYEHRPILYDMYMLWLVFQSIIAFLIFLFLIFILCVLSFTFSSIRLGLFTIFCVITSIYGYACDMLTNPCEGLFYLDKKKYRRVYDSVNEISQWIHGPRIHDIYISFDFNAAATSRHSLTPFRRNILIWGFPLVCSMSQKGLSGCLAHEIGHLKHNHMSVATILMILQNFWLNAHLGIISLFFYPWVRYWLAALQNAARPIFRKHEIEADEYIIDSLGGQYAAACQVELLLQAARFSDVTENMLAAYRSDRWPQFDIVRYLRNELNKNLPTEKADALLQREMNKVANVFDEHPSFAERLKLASCTYPKQYAQFQADAFDRYLAPDDALFSELNAYFHALLDPISEEYRNQSQQAQEWLEANPPSVEMKKELMLRALGSLELAGRKEERTVFLEECLKSYPNDPEFRAIQAFQIAPLEPERAKQTLEECLAQSSSLYLMDENNFLLQYYMETGDREKLRGYLQLREGRMNIVQKSIDATLSEKDELTFNELPDELKELLCSVLKSKFTSIVRAYSVKRSVDKVSSYSVSFIVLEYKPKRFRLAQSTDDILAGIRVEGYVTVIMKTDFCQNYLEPIPHACFYNRGS